jgi:hypothetical protein
MNFLHSEFTLNAGDVINVELDSQANVQLMDDPNFNDYKRVYNYRYYGGLVKHSPFKIAAPRTDHWNVVIDLGGYSGTVKASVSVIRRS